MMKKFFLLFAVLGLIFTSCDDYNDAMGDGDDEPSIEVGLSSMNFGAEGGEKELEIKANVEYELLCDVAWVSYTRTENGVVITVDSHFVKSDRQATFVVANKEFDIYKTVEIEQAAYDSKYVSNAALEKSEIEWDELLVKGTTSGDRNFSYDVRVLQGADFCSAVLTTGKVGEEFVLSFTKNMWATDRVAEVKVMFSDGTSKVLAVKQLAKRIEVEVLSYNRMWIEQPDKNENKHYIHKTYYSTLMDGARVRNFSVCYDTVKMCSRWVAYPAHSTYRKWGSYQVGENNNSGRTNAWAFDDAVTKYAPSTDYNMAYEIVSKYVASKDAYDTATEPVIPHRRQADICYDRAFGWGWARGHMLPSSQRYNTWENNAQTCYATNIMVQQYDFNSGGWADLESLERSRICSDTLYVVVGTLFEDSKTITRFDKTIGVPTHCYKLLLRTKSGYTGKSIRDITSANDVICIGFLYENSAASADATMQSAAMSVAEIEKRSGFKFFRNLNPAIADQVKSQKQLSDWGI